MKLFENNDKLLKIKQRATDLLISKEFAGRDFEQHKKLAAEDEDRTLLDVEVNALERKAVEDSQSEWYKSSLNDDLHQHVCKSIEESLSGPVQLFNVFIKIEPELGQLFDVLSLRAASIKRVLKIVETIPWLCTDIIDLVNKPQYRKNNDVKLDNVNLALSYLGLDNLQRLLPALAYRHFLPQSTRPFGTMRRKLWANALGQALAAEVLSEYNAQPLYMAYVSAFVIGLSDAIITRLFLTGFDYQQEANLKEAYKEKDKKRYNIIAGLTPDPTVLTAMLDKHRAQTAKAIAEHLAPERLPLVQLYSSLFDSDKFSEFSAMAKILAQAQAYIEFKHLNIEELISNKEALTLLSSVKLRQEHLELLKKANTSKLRLHQEAE